MRLLLTTDGDPSHSDVFDAERAQKLLDVYRVTLTVDRAGVRAGLVRRQPKNGAAAIPPESDLTEMTFELPESIPITSVEYVARGELQEAR